MRGAALILTLVGASACTITKIGDGGGDSSGGGGAIEADAAPLPDPVDELPGVADAAPVEDDGCYRGALGRLEMIDQTAFTAGSGIDTYYGLSAAIDDVPVGIFYLDLYGGIGSLPDGPLPGVYPIAGDDTNWSLCAVCVWASFGVEEKWVMAQSGTVTIDQVGGRLVGSLADIELVEIDELDEPIPGGCSATVDAADLDAPVE